MWVGEVRGAAMRLSEGHLSLWCTRQRQVPLARRLAQRRLQRLLHWDLGGAPICLAEWLEGPAASSGGGGARSVLPSGSEWPASLR